MQKRKAASHVFLEQHIQQQEEEDEQSLEENMPPPAVQTPYPVQVQTNMPNLKLDRSYTNTVQSEKTMNKNYMPDISIKSSEELQLEKEQINVRITGAWFWKKVIVPPNAYVVHTRINRKEPVTLGLGVSFRYNSYKDAYIVVPAAMQTIGVVANCISKEKQGLNILAYVQWQIADFSIAYKKLDISNSNDPLGIVNAQLREQAEAAIKDKIATMSVEEVLTDKAPIIEELTHRLSRVAEGKEGLGIKIITVQIREALVSSVSLWNDLQSPFRNEQRKKARISQLEMENEINQKELEARKFKETREAETNLEIELIKQKKFTETTELKLKEDSKRFEEEQIAIQKKVQLEEHTTLSKRETEDRLLSKDNELKLKRALEELQQKDKRIEEETCLALDAEKRRLSQETERKLYEFELDTKASEQKLRLEIHLLDIKRQILEKELDLETLKTNLESKLEKAKLESNLEREQIEKDIELQLRQKENNLNLNYEEQYSKILMLNQEVRNNVSSNQMTFQLITELANIASNMPKIQELKVIQTDQSDPVVNSLANFVTKIMSIADTFGINIQKPQSAQKE